MCKLRAKVDFRRRHPAALFTLGCIYVCIEVALCGVAHGTGDPTGPREGTHRVRGSDIPTPNWSRVTHAADMYLHTTVCFPYQLYFRQLRVTCILMNRGAVSHRAQLSYDSNCRKLNLFLRFSPDKWHPSFGQMHWLDCSFLVQQPGQWSRGAPGQRHRLPPLQPSRRQVHRSQTLATTTSFSNGRLGGQCPMQRLLPGVRKQKISSPDTITIFFFLFPFPADPC